MDFPMLQSVQIIPWLVHSICADYSITCLVRSHFEKSTWRLSNRVYNIAFDEELDICLPVCVNEEKTQYFACS